MRVIMITYTNSCTRWAVLKRGSLVKVPQPPIGEENER